MVIKGQIIFWIPRTTRGASGSANKQMINFLKVLVFHTDKFANLDKVASMFSQITSTLFGFFSFSRS